MFILNKAVFEFSLNALYALQFRNLMFIFDESIKTNEARENCGGKNIK